MTAPSDPGAEKRAAAERAAAESVRLANALREAGIGARFACASLANFVPENREQAVARSAVLNWTEKKAALGDGLLLYGPPGGGKTHLLVGALRECAAAGMPVRYVTAEEFFLGLRDAIAANTGEKKFLDSLVRPDVLALDDLHVLTEGEGYQYRSLWYLLDKRYFHARSTLVATNRGLDEFRELLDERTRRRLESGVVRVPGKETHA